MDTSTIKAEDIMTRHLVVTSPQTHVVDAIERLIAHRVSGLPVIDECGHFVGRFSERTAIAALDLGALRSFHPSTGRLGEVRADQIMNRTMPLLSSSQDVFQGINQLISRKVSGAPVVDADGTLRGVFSEQSAMHVFIGLCWEQLPSSCVTAWVDRQEDRNILEETRLDEILDRFRKTLYRRLMVLRGDKLVGQLTRQDALCAALANSREPLTASMTVTGERQMGVKTTVESWMQAEAVSITHNADVLAIAQRFLHSDARQLPVLDEGRIDGQISRSDLLRAVQKFFPEVGATAKQVQPLYLTSLNKHDYHAVT